MGVPQRVTRGEFDCAPEPAFRLFPLRFGCVNHPQRVVRFRQQRVQLDRLLRGGPPPRKRTCPIDWIIEARYRAACVAARPPKAGANEGSLAIACSKGRTLRFIPIKAGSISGTRAKVEIVGFS